jgi:hypothetical protein
MSIIYDALKKAESKNNFKMTEQNNQAKTPPQNLSNSKNNPLLIIILLLIIAASFFMVFRYINANSAKLKIAFSLNTGTTKQKNRRRLNPRTADKPEEIPVKKYSSGTYTLEGIIYDGQVPLAIINGQVLAKDALIEDWRIIEITDAAVKLLNTKDNREKKLIF